MADNIARILSVVQDTIERLDNFQGPDDCSSLVLRLEYLNRSIVNNAELPGSFVSDIGVAINHLKEADILDAHDQPNNCSGSKIYSGNPGRPYFDIKEEQLVCLVESGFNVPQIGQLLGVSTRTVERRMSRFGISITGKK